MDKVSFLTKYAENNRHYSFDREFDKVMSADSAYDKFSILSNPHVTDKHIDIAMKDPNESVVARAVIHPNVTNEQLNRATNHEHWLVRSSVLDSPNAKQHHIKALVNDSDLSIRSVAREMIK